MRILSLLFALEIFTGAFADDGSWQTLLETSRENLNAKQQALVDEYGLSSFERWDFSQEGAELVFSNAGVPGVAARVVIAGSYSGTKGTWLWGWANASVAAALTDAVKKVREFGRQHGYGMLVEKEWEAEEADGWDMAAVANYLLEGKGVYRAPHGQTSVFFVITDISVIQ